ncbi:hypothetical protein K438DRAFT_2008881, partial [Mycena galopus ATCC 62051]
MYSPATIDRCTQSTTLPLHPLFPRFLGSCSVIFQRVSMFSTLSVLCHLGKNPSRRFNQLRSLPQLSCVYGLPESNMFRVQPLPLYSVHLELIFCSKFVSFDTHAGSLISRTVTAGCHPEEQGCSCDFRSRAFVFISTAVTGSQDECSFHLNSYHVCKLTASFVIHYYYVL